jgi:hypothetical protein
MARMSVSGSTESGDDDDDDDEDANDDDDDDDSDDVSDESDLVSAEEKVGIGSYDKDGEDDDSDDDDDDDDDADDDDDDDVVIGELRTSDDCSGILKVSRSSISIARSSTVSGCWWYW